MGGLIGMAAGLALLISGPGAVPQTATPDREAFVRQVFASYADPDGKWPLHDQVLDEVWTPRMAALIRRDRELATEDLPYLDADPLCQCQDTEGLTVRSVRAQTQAGRPMLRVAFTNGGEAMETVLAVEDVPGQGWRIADVRGEDGYSLAAQLELSNRRIESGGQALGRD